jgi:hypothetical protein
MTYPDPLSLLGLVLFPATLILAQAASGATPDASIFTPLLQLGAVGAVLAWFALVDAPAKQKALERATDAWRGQLDEERKAGQAREVAFREALVEHAEALCRIAETQATLAKSLDVLSNELREDRRRSAA